MKFVAWRRVAFWGGLAAVVYIAQSLGLLGSSNKVSAAFNDNNNVVEVALDDAAVNSAVEEARATLPLFLEHASTEPAGWENVAIKVALQADGPVENIWVGSFKPLEDGSFIGQLDNDPVYLGDLKAGSEVQFRYDQIVDWAFVEQGVGYGFYSVRALVGAMSEEQAAAVEAFLAPGKVPATW
ncbi:DUF2314 domain-containing protein [Tropicimonas sp. S265A]|uniref:DUF2314 domain-containing protein n=1 Tax=Tropicimonas sp. S265A TaxID=3415134 RepID=UPI003C7A7053